MEVGRVFICQPTYGSGDSNSHRAFWVGHLRDGDKLHGKLTQMQGGGSLLAATFNSMWCEALNQQEAGEDITHFGMLHDDIVPEDGWLSILMEDLRDTGADIVSAVVPIKNMDLGGLTSTAIDNPRDQFKVARRLTIQEVRRLPQTFTAEDCGYPNRALLVNTGCWVCRFDRGWRYQAKFNIGDCIRFVFGQNWDRFKEGDWIDQREASFLLPPLRNPDNSLNTLRPKGKWCHAVNPEDWNFSRQLHALGCKIVATRRVRLTHSGRLDYANYGNWGGWSHDINLAKEPIRPDLVEPTDVEPERDRQFVPPWPSKEMPDVEGWLSDDEGRFLKRLAQGKDVLEIGCYKGRSTIWMARTAKQVVTIDTFTSDAVGDKTHEDTLAEAESNAVKYGVNERINFVRGQGTEILRQVRGVWEPFDLAFIDGDHRHTAVTADVRAVLYHLKAGGLLAFHDSAEPGVEAVVRRLVTDIGLNIVDHCGSITVLKAELPHRAAAKAYEEFLREGEPIEPEITGVVIHEQEAGGGVGDIVEAIGDVVDAVNGE